MLSGPLSSANEKIKWLGSHGDFISLVEFFEAIGGFKSAQGRAMADELGELFLKVIDIDLTPYPDFHTMKMSVTSSAEPAVVAKKILERVDAEEQLSDALEDTGVTPSPEMRANNIFSWMVAHDFINKLSKYINIPNK